MCNSKWDPGCFHSDSRFLGGDGNPNAVSKLKVGDMIMVFEESNLADPTLGVPTKAAILGWTRCPGAPTAGEAPVNFGDNAGCSTILDFLEITYSYGTDYTRAMPVTTGHYIRVNAGANLKLAGDLSEGEEIEVWSADANSIVAGKITGLRRFVDNVAAVYSPITDKGTNFVAASGDVVPMAGESRISGVVVNHNHATMLHSQSPLDHQKGRSCRLLGHGVRLGALRRRAFDFGGARRNVFVHQQRGKGFASK